MATALYLLQLWLLRSNPSYPTKKNVDWKGLLILLCKFSYHPWFISSCLFPVYFQLFQKWLSVTNKSENLQKLWLKVAKTAFTHFKTPVICNQTTDWTCIFDDHVSANQIRAMVFAFSGDKNTLIIKGLPHYQTTLLQVSDLMDFVHQTQSNFSKSLNFHMNL